MYIHLIGLGLQSRESRVYESATEKLYAFVDYFVDSNIDRSLNRTGEEFINRVGADSEFGKRLIAISTVLIETCEKLVLMGISAGVFKPENPKELALIILSCHMELGGTYQFMDKETMKNLCRKATTLFLQGINIKTE